MSSAVRACLRAFVVMCLVASAVPAAAEQPTLRRAILELSDEQRDSVAVLPAHATVPASSTGIGPGSQLMIERPDGAFICTANFVWTETTTHQVRKRNGKPFTRKPPVVTKTLYLGAAGHCFLPENKTTTHGPDADYDPAAAKVSVCVDACEFGDQLGPATGTFVRLGKVAYARQTSRGQDFANDFGIVEIPRALADEHLRPSIPVWEGPSSVQDVPDGGPVCVYGNGTAVGAVFATKARPGVGQGTGDDGRFWRARMPSAPGDSGAALVTCGEDEDELHGRGAAGILTHIGLAQETASIVGTTTSRAVEMTRRDAGIKLRLMLEDGTEVDPPPLEKRPPPPPVITADEPRHAVAVGGSHSWTAGPFTTSPRPEETFFSDGCSGTDPRSEHCDYEFVTLDVPRSGANVSVTVSTPDAEGDDFDVFLFDQNGTEVTSAAAAGTPPEVATATVTQAGPYTIAIDPYDTTDATYSGVVTLEPLPPAVERFDGEISVGTSHAWSGDPSVDANPLFTCADAVSSFCDNEAIKVNVPSGGGTLVVDVTADAPDDDFDLCVYAPSNEQNCVSETGNEHLELEVTDAGVYRVGVKAYFARGTFSATATLR